MKLDYDILIVGGGMVGGSLAVALGETGFRVGLVEAHPFGSGSEPAYDDRAIALAYGSSRIFAGVGLWQAMQDEVTPIRRIHVSDRGHLGVTRLDCRDEGVDALGYVVDSRVMGRVLNDRFPEVENLDVITPARLDDLSLFPDHVAAELDCADGRRSITTRLLVAADGTLSPIRRMLGIEVERQDYGQAALIANVSTEKPHDSVAYERFTDSGPIALLPMSEGRCSLVWTARDEQVSELLELDDGAFLARLQERFGYRLGRLQRVGRRHSYPLRLIQAKEQVRPRVALIGNASHTIHPVAGQGFNLGIRDVAVLADILIEVFKSGGDPGGSEPLQGYAQWRRQDHKRVVTITDTLARLFANPFEPLRMARNLALVGLDITPGLKHRVARQFMGLSGRLPRLARGVPLV